MMSDYKQVIYDAVHDAWVEKLIEVDFASCIRDALFVGGDICKSFKVGIMESMPAECEIVKAVTEGVYESLSVMIETIEKQGSKDGQADQKNQKDVDKRGKADQKAAKNGQKARF